MIQEAKFKENEALLNWKLVLNFIMTLIGGATALYAIKTPFANSKLIVGVGSLAYLLLQGVYYIWLTYFVQRTCFRGTSPKAPHKTIWIESKLALPEANYQLYLVNPVTGKQQGPTQEWNIGTLIYEDGQICGDSFVASMESFLRNVNKSD